MKPEYLYAMYVYTYSHEHLILPQTLNFEVYLFTTEEATEWKENMRTSIVLERHSVTSQSARGLVFDPDIKWRVWLPRPPHVTDVTVIVTWPHVLSRQMPARPSSCPMEIPCARPKRRKTGVALQQTALFWVRDAWPGSSTETHST